MIMSSKREFSKMRKGISHVDPVFDALGGTGRYQCIQVLVVLISGLSSTFQLLNIVFVGRPISHTCGMPDNMSDIFTLINDEKFTMNTSVVEFQKCNIRVESNISGIVETTSLECVYGHKYEEQKDFSVMSDMDVICDKAALKGLGQTLLILGQGVGAFVIPIMSDRYGRRPVHLISHFLMLVLGIGVAFSPTYLVFLVLRVFVGAFQQGVVMTRATFTVEIFPARHRKLSAFLSGILLSVTSMIIPLLGYLTRDLSWRMTQLVFCCLIFYVFVQFLWLMANGKDKQVRKILKKAAKINGKNVQEVLNVYNGLKEKNEDQTYLTESLLGNVEANVKESKLSTSRHKTHPSFLDLMKRKRLALNVMVLWFIWFTDSMIFFGLYMTSHSLVGSRYINFFLLALMKSPAAFVNYFMLDRYGRKKTSILLHGIAGSGLILATVIRHVGHGSEWAETAVTVFTCIGMFGITGAWGGSFFFTPEMFPTNLRNMGLGTSSSFSRLGGMLAPFASLLADYVSWAPGAIFAGCCVLVTILVNLLPETMGREVPQTLHDLEQWYKKEPNEKDGRMDLSQRKELKEC